MTTISKGRQWHTAGGKIDAVAAMAGDIFVGSVLDAPAMPPGIHQSKLSDWHGQNANMPKYGVEMPKVGKKIH